MFKKILFAALVAVAPTAAFADCISDLLGSGINPLASQNICNLIANPTLNTVSVENGTAAAPSVTFSSDTDTGVFRSSANTIGLSAGGTERATVSANGLTATSGFFAVTAADNVAAAGSTISDATVLATSINRVSPVGSGQGVRLPDRTGSIVAIYNRDGTNALLIYPPNGSTQINAGSGGAGFSLAALARTVCFQAAATRWFCI